MSFDATIGGGGLVASLRPRAARVARQVSRRGAQAKRLVGAGASDLTELVTELERSQREGVIVEAGCARGGSAIAIAAAKHARRPLRVFDVFGLIPPPSSRDGADVHDRYQVIASGRAGPDYYGYDEDLLSQVRRSFERHGVPTDSNGVELVKGLYEETLHVESSIALAHIDCDWYDSVLVCLQRIEPKLAPGGVLVIDDYRSWSGARQAVDDYFADKRDGYDFRDRARLQIVKR